MTVQYIPNLSQNFITNRLAWRDEQVTMIARLKSEPVLDVENFLLSLMAQIIIKLFMTIFAELKVQTL